MCVCVCVCVCMCVCVCVLMVCPEKYSGVSKNTIIILLIELKIVYRLIKD